MPNRINMTIDLKPTLEVAIPAFNEEISILHILLSLLGQDTNNFRLKCITVYSDRSTDNTDNIVKKTSQKYPLVRLKIGKTRLGKYLRLNEVFRACKSDILVILDADIALDGKKFLVNLVEEMNSDKKFQMISAHQIMVRPKKFMEKIVYTNFLLWDYVRWSIPGYDSGNNFYASATAFRGSFARTIQIPTNLTDPHLYLYLMAANCRGFRYCTKARIFQQPITTFKDYQKFLRRPLGKKDDNLEKLLNVSAEEIYRVSVKYKIIGLIKCFWYEPFYTPLSLLLGIYGKIYLRLWTNKNSSSIWEIVTSTKKKFI